MRQMALLGFRDLVLLKLSLGDLLRKNLSLIPASITQMLLVLQVNVNCKPILNSHLYITSIIRVCFDVRVGNSGIQRPFKGILPIRESGGASGHTLSTELQAHK